MIRTAAAALALAACATARPAPPAIEPPAPPHAPSPPPVAIVVPLSGPLAGDGNMFAHAALGMLTHSRTIVIDSAGDDTVDHVLAAHPTAILGDLTPERTTTLARALARHHMSVPIIAPLGGDGANVRALQDPDRSGRYAAAMAVGCTRNGSVVVITALDRRARAAQIPTMIARAQARHLLRAPVISLLHDPAYSTPLELAVLALVRPACIYGDLDSPDILPLVDLAATLQLPIRWWIGGDTWATPQVQQHLSAPTMVVTHARYGALGRAAAVALRSPPLHPQDPTLCDTRGC